MKRILIILFLMYPFILQGQNFGSTKLSSYDGKFYNGITIIFSAINGTTTFFNIKKMNKYDRYRSNAIFGAISGCAQTAFGIVGFHKDKEDILVPANINIGLGITTLATSVIRLATKNPPRGNDMGINMFYIPGKMNSESVWGLNIKIQIK
jgi:hypothetical protein